MCGLGQSLYKHIFRVIITAVFFIAMQVGASCDPQMILCSIQGNHTGNPVRIPVGASLFTILSYLGNGHVLCINLINNRTGIYVITTYTVIAIHTFYLGSTIVKKSNISIIQNGNIMLCIEPFEIFSLRSKEVRLIHTIPACRISKDPCQGFVLFIYCYNGIFVSCRKKNQIILCIIGKTIIMEPVSFLTSV